MAMKKTEWAGNKIEKRDVGSLVPYEKNSRTHSEEQIDQIAASINEWGFTMPILVDEEDTIIAGHARVAAAGKLKIKTVPVIVARGWTKEQKQAYVIADNKLAINAGWDAMMLSQQLTELEGSGIDMSMVGFSEEDLSRLQVDLDQIALSNMIDSGGDDKGEGPTKNPGAKPVPFSLVLASDARAILQDAINIMKKKRDLSTSAEALVAICTEWKADHGKAN